MPWKNTRWIRKSHRWIGAAAAAWLFVLAFTGILLQHAEDWGLDKKSVHLPWLLASQGYTPRIWIYTDPNHGATTIQGFGGKIYRLPLTNGESLSLPEKPVSVLRQNKMLWLIFPDQIWQMDAAGEIFLQLDQVDGLKTPVLQARWHQPYRYILLMGQDTVQRFDTHQLAFSSVPQEISQAVPSPAPVQSTTGVILENHLAKGLLSWQKLIFSWHAGLVGSWWLNDFAAVALMFLSLSGLWLFVRKKRRQ